MVGHFETVIYLLTNPDAIEMRFGTEIEQSGTER